ncbi:MAG: BtpA/SgcQ family protein, partial [Planctomycetota bacterium]
MTKTFMGVVHLRSTPSSCGGSVSMDELLAYALADARALADGGCDAVMIENFGDAPFRKGGREDPVPPDTVAALAVAAREVRLATGLPVGVNCLRNDAIGGLGAGAVAGATYVRVNVLNGAM